MDWNVGNSNTQLAGQLLAKNDAGVLVRPFYGSCAKPGGTTLFPGGLPYCPQEGICVWPLCGAGNTEGLINLCFLSPSLLPSLKEAVLELQT